ncbi:MAG: BtrH N-terminal domain-containing protein [Chloroflexota bacterium]
MGQILTIPHRLKDGLCPVNGIRDLVHWRAGRDWANEFLWGLGQGGGFAYLRINPADPPRQVYWGTATPRQHRYLAELFGAGFTESENRAFKSSWLKAREAVDAGTPPVLGPLDMFHLPFYQDLYHKRHIPIHYLLLVGYDDEHAYVHDTGQEEVQALPLDELRQAWDVNVPGLGKRNRWVVLDVPQNLPPTGALIRKSIADECQTMLHPPVSMVGIPAMKKVAREMAGWPEELGEDKAARCLRQVREYLNSPPDVEGHHLTAGRDLYVAFLQQAGVMAGLDFSAAIRWLGESLAIIPEIAGAIGRGDLAQAAAGFGRIAEREAAAFDELSRIVGSANP